MGEQELRSARREWAEAEAAQPREQAQLSSGFLAMEAQMHELRQALDAAKSDLTRLREEEDASSSSVKEDVEVPPVEEVEAALAELQNAKALQHRNEALVAELEGRVEAAPFSPSLEATNGLASSTTRAVGSAAAAPSYSEKARLSGRPLNVRSKAGGPRSPRLGAGAASDPALTSAVPSSNGSLKKTTSELGAKTPPMSADLAARMGRLAGAWE